MWVFVVGILLWGAVDAATPDGIVDKRVTVAKGSPLVFDSSYAGQFVTNIVLHDDLTLDMGVGTTTKTLKFFPVDGNNVVFNGTTTAEIGPSAGDDATLTVKPYSYLEGYCSNTSTTPNGSGVSAGMHADVCLGRNGGTGRIVVGGMVNGSCQQATVRFRNIELAANATVPDNEDLITINKYGRFAQYTIVNRNAKDLRIRIATPDGSSCNGYDSNAQFQPYAGKDVFECSGGGDIVVTGAANAPILIASWSGWGYTLLKSSPNGRLRFEGGGDVYLDIGYAGYSAINSTNIVWNHSGETIFLARQTPQSGYTYKPFQIQADYALPHGPQTGDVRIRGLSSVAQDVAVDLKGHSQYVNGLKLTDRGQLISTSGSPTVTFGVGDTDGTVKGPLTAENISFVKAGAGTLTLDGADFNALTVTGGTVRVKFASVNHIGTLAMTNATLVISPAQALTVDTWLTNDTARVVCEVPSTGMMNEMSVSGAELIGAEIVKEGSNYHTLTMPADAHGSPLHVKGGTLRLGGETCGNQFWRFTAKKAKANTGNARGIARGKTYNITLPDSSVYTVYVSAGLGTLGFFTPEGLATRNDMSSVSGTPAASTLDYGQSFATPGYVSGWNVSWIKNHLNPNQTSDPILGGGTSGNSVHFINMNESWRTVNKYDLKGTNGASCYIPNWSGGILYTNDFVMLDPEVPSTWVSVTWREKNWSPAVASYALRRIVNTDYLNITDWMLESSPTGEDDSWVTMDERQNQTYGAKGYNDQFNYTYNGRVTYLFKGLAWKWRFETFGAVRVDAGATLETVDLPMTNIAFNALTVDCAGAGTITRFRPALNGTLNVISDAASRNSTRVGKLKKTVILPLILTETSDMDRLETWKVTVDGRPAPDSTVAFADGKLVVTSHFGLTVIFR